MSVFDMLPFPNITSDKPEEQIKQLIDYLNQFKEDLEFILSAMQDNSIPVKQIEDTVNQVAYSTLSISEVVGSYAFKQAVLENAPEIVINRENGHLEYKNKGGE